MSKQVINGHIRDESALYVHFADNVGPSDRVFRTATGYVIVSVDEDAPKGAEALGQVSEWYEEFDAGNDDEIAAIVARLGY